MLKVAIIVLAANFIVCGYSAPGRCESGASKVPAAGEQKPAQEIKTSTMEGVVTLVEADGTVIVLDANRKTSILYIKKETVLTRDGKPAKLSDLKVGDKVSAKYAGMNIAVEVSITAIPGK